MKKQILISGQSMFELLVAVFVIGITLVALVGLTARSIANTTFSRERTLAAKYTQEAVEWLRAERDQDWGSFRSRGTPEGANFCMESLVWAPGTSCPVIPGTGLTRRMSLFYSPASPDSVEARVVTSWSDSAGVHESRITTYFTNWRTR